jgi:hypothetical protein
MAPLSKLTLTSYRPTQPNRDPVEERRSKTLAAGELDTALATLVQREKDPLEAQHADYA